MEFKKGLKFELTILTPVNPEPQALVYLKDQIEGAIKVWSEIDLSVSLESRGILSGSGFSALILISDEVDTVEYRHVDFLRDELVYEETTLPLLWKLFSYFYDIALDAFVNEEWK